MAFKKGELILLDYTAKIKDNGEVFETTIEEDAKKNSIHDPNIKYQPKLVSVGESWVIKGLDEALENTSVGDKTTVEVSPDKGFGERDSGKVRMIPLRKLGEDAEKVSIGDTIEVDNKKGIVRFIGSGRIKIDYNHRFAGKTILYDINVLKELKSDEDKITGILKKNLPIEDEKIIFNKKDKILDIIIPQEIFRAENLPIIKHFIQMDLFKFVLGLEKITFTETYEKPDTKKETKQESKTKDNKK